ncbi:unnamed protein product [Nesidiocoris tenuis]|uniref:Uncharacterized protein n=1 Tax=Nesidiocoris tenuis TaxID=355587 RepID=A0A6H5G8F8_9HEMI|nr:unnamed protein product [Nesidiocoris tenuis]
MARLGSRKIRQPNSSGAESEPTYKEEEENYLHDLVNGCVKREFFFRKCVVLARRFHSAGPLQGSAFFLRTHARGPRTDPTSTCTSEQTTCTSEQTTCTSNSTSIKAEKRTGNQLQVKYQKKCKNRFLMIAEEAHQIGIDSSNVSKIQDDRGEKTSNCWLLESRLGNANKIQ